MFLSLLFSKYNTIHKFVKGEVGEDSQGEEEKGMGPEFSAIFFSLWNKTFRVPAFWTFVVGVDFAFIGESALGAHNS